MLITAAQSLFALALLWDLSLPLIGGAMLFALSAVQLVFPETRMAITAVYLVLTPLVLLRSRTRLRAAFEWIVPLPIAALDPKQADDRKGQGPVV